MGSGRQTPGEWDSSGPGEPPAQLLRRAISHVESLLHRLESPEPSRALVAGPSDPLEPEEHAGPAEPAPEPVPEPSAEDRPTPELTGNVVELSRPDPLAVVTSGARPPRSSPLPARSSTAQAEALRITLHAHEEANRLRAEANQLRAEAAAEGERILVEARLLSDRLHMESRESATELLQAARTEAAAILAVARDEADVAAPTSSPSPSRSAPTPKLAALDEIAREAERIRAQAREAGQAEAARLVEAELAAAASEGREALEAESRAGPGTVEHGPRRHRGRAREHASPARGAE